MTEPFLSWAGSKRRLAPELAKLVPPYVGSRPDRRYVEPFAGSAALFFAVNDQRAVNGSMAHAILSDANDALMMAFLGVRDHVDDVVGVLRWHATRHAETGKAHYYRERDGMNAWLGIGHAYNNFLDPPAITDRVQKWCNASLAANAARFLYLNKACFNALWRVSRDGEMNTPAGDLVLTAEQAKGVNKIIDEANLRACSAALANATILAGDYTDALRTVCAGDFVYADSPYDGTFSSYTADGFDADAHAALAQAMRDCVKLGARVLISNSDTPFVRSLYEGDDFKIGTLPCMHSIAASGKKRKQVDELVIVGGGVKDWKQTELLL